MTDVFISYKREEREAARRLAAALQKRGFSVWWDAELLPGEQYRAVTLEILQSCHAAIVIWSPKSVQSSWVLDEAQRALDRGVLVPVHLEKISAYPLGFGQLHTHDLTSWDGGADHTAVQPLFAAVQRLAGAPGVEPQHTPSQAEIETEVAFWRGVHDSRDAADFEAYLKRYPEGLFAELARRRAETAPARSRQTSPQPWQSPSPLPATSVNAGSLNIYEIGFIALAAVVSAFLAWPIANAALGLEALFYPQDYALLFSLATPQNLIIMTPLLVGLAWGYDRVKTMWAARGGAPSLVQFGVLAALILFFLISLGMREHDGRETHMALWLLFVWAAASFARPAVARLQPLVQAQPSRRN